MQHFITVQSCESSASVKENPDKKNQKLTQNELKIYGFHTKTNEK